MRIFKKISAVIVAVSALSTCFVPVVSMAEVRDVNVNTLSEETVDFYGYWKEKYLAQDPYVKDQTQYYVCPFLFLIPVMMLSLQNSFQETYS